METTQLRDLVESQINQRWDVWAAAHPNLAAAIDQIQLTDSVVSRLNDNPDFIQAMQQAAVDEDKLGTAAQLISLVAAWVTKLLPL